MNWIPIKSEDQIETIIERSADKPQLIFKHSIRCGVSALVKNRLDKEEQPEGIDLYYLDLINHRSISTRIAETFHVPHQSPQVLIIKNGKCIYDESHMAINMKEILMEIE